MKCITHSDSSSGLQSELGGKLVEDGAGIAYLSLHLPVAQKLVLHERNGRRGEGWDTKKCKNKSSIDISL